MSALTKLRRPAAACAAALAAATMLAACSGGGTDGDGFTYKSATKVGTVIPAGDRKQAEDVKGSLLSGGTTSLAAYKGKVVLMSFWATWCPPCTIEVPQYDTLYRSVKSDGVQVLGVNTKNERGPANAFVKDNDISFPSIFDQDGQVLLQLGNIPSAGLPVSVLVDKQQRVAAVYVGRLIPSQVRPVVDKLAAEHA